MNLREPQKRRLLLALLCWMPGIGPAWAQAIVPMQSQPGPNEIDTAARGGQAGGRLIGLNYSLTALRCQGAGAAIVGVRIRRGDVLDSLQIACAVPVCANGTCRWTSSSWAAGAGNGNGGDAQPPMLCDQTEMVSGFRGRVVTFTRFDYASDIEIECSAITAAIAQGGFRVARTGGSWHHGQGGLGLNGLPGNVIQATLTRPITCRPNGGATAVSLGIADNFVNPGQRVLQAVSFYCPASAADPSCPDSLSVAAVDNQSAAVQQQWFAPSAFSSGGRTAGGSVATMHALPDAQSWDGAQITETVTLDPNAAQCPVPNPAALCTTGTGRPFTVGDPATQKSLANGLTVPWNPPAGHHNNFPDMHFVFDPRRTPQDYLGLVANPPANCTVTCRQTYACGGGNARVAYGPFAITYRLVHGTWRTTFAGVPVSQPTPVTMVTATKQ